MSASAVRVIYLTCMENINTIHTFIILLQMLQYNMTVFMTGLEISIRHIRFAKKNPKRFTVQQQFFFYVHVDICWKSKSTV